MRRTMRATVRITTPVVAISTNQVGGIDEFRKDVGEAHAAKGDPGCHQVGAEMYGICLDGGALIGSCDLLQGVSAVQVENHRYDEHDHRPKAGRQVGRLEEEPPDHLVHDKAEGDEEEHAFGEGCEVLRLLMPVRVIAVGRPLGVTDGEKSDDRHQGVEHRVDCLSNKREVSCLQSHRRP